MSSIKDEGGSKPKLACSGARIGMCEKMFFGSRFEKSIEISQALETVWNRITDFDKTAEIADGIERFELTSDRPFGMGSTVR